MDSLGLNPFKFFGKYFDALQDQILAFLKWYFVFVCMFVSMHHDLMTSVLQLIPQTKITHGPGMIFIREFKTREDVQ